MKKTKLPKPITILILTLLTSVVWVGLGIYRSITIKPPAEVPETISTPLNAVLDTSVIQKIESAVFFSDSEIPPITLGGTIVPSILPIEQTPTPTPEASPSATPQATPEATASASPQSI